MTPRLVIFDCDGVLVDSERLALRIDAEMLADLGCPLPDDEIVRRFLGRSDADGRRELERLLGRELPDGFDEPYHRRYRALLERELTPVPGVVAALDRIPVPVCVASSGTHDKMRLTLGVTGLYARFAGRIVSVTEVERGKPAPDLFLHAAGRFGADPSECAVVEDSQYGVAAARAAGMAAFGYAGGLTPADWLAGPGTVVFDDMRDLPGLLGFAGDVPSPAVGRAGRTDG